MMPHAPFKNYLTAQQISAFLNISLPAVYHLTRLKKLEAVKLDNQIRYRPEDVNRYVKTGYDFRPDSRRKGDRRKFPHIDCFVEAHAVISLPPFKHWEAHGYVINLNLEGLYFEAAEADPNADRLQVQDPVEIILHFPSALRQKIPVQGKVAHIQRNHSICFGVQFSGLPPEIAQFLKSYINP